MMGEDIINEALGYLKKKGPVNTFRLAREMGLERHKLLNILKKLEEKKAIRFERGNAIFIKFPSEEKLVKTLSPKPKKKKTEKVAKRKPIKPKALELLQTENKQLREKLLELEENIKKLEQKSATPKTVIKTIIKKVPVTKTVIKKIPVLVKERKEEKKISEKFKLPKFELMKNIKKLKKPEFVK